MLLVQCHCLVKLMPALIGAHCLSTPVFSNATATPASMGIKETIFFVLAHFKCIVGLYKPNLLV